MSYKTETLAAYDKYAEIFEQKFEFHLDTYVKEFIREFAGSLPVAGLVLDLGSGPGNHAMIYQVLGFRTVCMDLSYSMATLCARRGIPSMVMDFEQLGIRAKSIDGIWAYTSLLHIPKSHLPRVLGQLSKLLKPSGVLAVAMKSGHSEEFISQPDKYPGTRRWFSLYQDEELQKTLTEHFRVSSHSTTTTLDNTTYLNYLLSLK